MEFHAFHLSHLPLSRTRQRCAQPPGASPSASGTRRYPLSPPAPLSGWTPYKLVSCRSPDPQAGTYPFGPSALVNTDFSVLNPVNMTQFPTTRHQLPGVIPERFYVKKKNNNNNNKLD